MCCRSCSPRRKRNWARCYRPCCDHRDGRLRESCEMGLNEIAVGVISTVVIMAVIALLNNLFDWGLWDRLR